jgi:hypothetical protein
MSHICANDEYQSQVGATKRPENIVICYVSFVSLLSICILGAPKFAEQLSGAMSIHVRFEHMGAQKVQL